MHVIFDLHSNYSCFILWEGGRVANDAFWRGDYIVLPGVVNAKSKKATANRNGTRHEPMVKSHFKNCKKRMLPRLNNTLIPLVKDLERLLRQPRNLKAEKAAGFKTLTQHSKCSPDMNAIENCWDLLRGRLLFFALVENKSPAVFIKRLRRIVS